MIINFKYPIGPYTIWSEEAVKGLIGTSFSAKLGTKEIGKGEVIEVRIIDEGRFLDLTLKWPDDPESMKLLYDPLTSISF